ncbi:Deleted in malignant brain tumors 1 protein, partial [Dryobates pubescens]
ELRLANGPSGCSGRVEVLHDHQWGTICDDDWSFPEAMVVCRQLGCGEAFLSYGGAHFGQGSGPIWLDNIQCRGDEAALSQCPARPWGVHNCDHGEDASVVCTDARMGASECPWEESSSDLSLCPTPGEGSTMDSAPQAPLQLRLEAGPGRCAGRLELLRYRQWGTVCDRSWSLAEATVVCRQLGCGTALSAPGSAAFGPGSGRIWLDDVNCTGREGSLSQCQSTAWRANSCDHRGDVGVVCSGERLGAAGVRLGAAGAAESCPRKVSTGGGVFSWPLSVLGTSAWRGDSLSPPPFAGAAPAAESPEASLRLVGGPDRCAGRLEVLHNGTWGTVCDDSWGPPEGQVVCRQLGCGTLLSVAPGGRYGEGTGQIWLDEVNCTGEEETLSKCQSRPWGQHNCQHLEDASVECSGSLGQQAVGWEVTSTPPALLVGPYLQGDSSISKLGPLRLQGGPNRCAGRVEVLHSQRWGTVCDDGWDLAEAAVVCRQLGCGAPIWAAAPGAYFGRGHDPIWLDELQCTGSEQSLFSCQAREWGHNNCVHGEDAGVVC